MNRRRTLLIAIGTSTLAAPLPCFAQQQGKVWRIGFMTSRPEPGRTEQAFLDAMRALGYVEGRNLVIEWRFSTGDVNAYRKFAASLVRLKVGCMVVNGIDAARAAKQASGTIPIVITNATDDPVRLGLIASLARPGGNITGLVSANEELAAKRLQLLKEAVPKASRIGVLWDEKSSAVQGHLKEIDKAARTLGLRLIPLALQSAKELEAAFHTATKERVDAMMVVTAGLITGPLRSKVIELASASRVPAMYSNTQFVFEGGLMGYSSDIPEQHRRAAIYVDKIFRGAKPGDLPVELPTKFEFVINLKAAKQIGLTIPPGVLARADRVIE